MTPEMLLAKMLSDAPVMVEKTASSEEETNYSMEKAAWADSMGRALAREDFEKTAFIAHGVGKALGAIKGMGSAIGGAVKAAPGAGKGMLQSAKSGLSNAGSAIKNAPGKAMDFMKKDLAATKEQFTAGLSGKARPALAKTPVPGVHHNVGTVVPPVQAAAPAATQYRLTGLSKGLLAGGAIGAGGMALAGRNKPQQPGMERTASVQRLDAALEKMAALPAMGSLLQGAKAFGTKALGQGKNLAGQAMIASQHMGAGGRAAVGAGAGATLGAAKGLVAPGTDANGQKNGRLGAMARGAAGGAALGAGAGLASKGIVRAVGSSNTAIGGGVRNTMQHGLDNVGSQLAKAGPAAAAAHAGTMKKFQGNITAMGRAANVSKIRSAVPPAGVV